MEQAAMKQEASDPATLGQPALEQLALATPTLATPVKVSVGEVASGC